MTTLTLAAAPAAAAEQEDLDRRLLAAVAAAPGAAPPLAELFERHAARVVRLARRLTGDAALADEVAQETFLEVRRCAGSYRGQGSARAWICQIATHLARRSLERERRRREVHASAPSPRPAPTPPAADAELLEQGLAALPLEQRAALQLAVVEEMRAEEIALVLGCPLGTVWSRVYHAKRNLAARLREAGWSEEDRR